METRIIQWLQSRFQSRDPVLLGIGDDAAILSPQSKRLVWTTDAIIDQVHFDSTHDSWQRIGKKAVAVNLSDLAAMGATPTAILVALALPSATTLENVQTLYAGISYWCDRFGVQIAGGDTNSTAGPLMICISALGYLADAHRGWQCGGARAGDSIVVSGSLGGSLAGHHLDFEPRCELAEYLAGTYPIHAATDVSDGLVFDLNTICQRSGVGARIQLDRIPISDVLQDTKAAPAVVLEHALYDGEDFELILAVSPEDTTALLSDGRIGSMLTRIGEFTANRSIVGVDADRRQHPLTIRGYQHGETT